jgi:N-acetylmuramoyl-L-alanine amidase
VRFHWLLSSFLTIFLLSSPAFAAKLQSWRFDETENRLYITTDDNVQPKAKLIFNPTRLVIDLPGTSLGRQAVTQPVGGAIQAIRVGQFDTQTTRLVVELADGYTIDPKQVLVRGQTPNQWTVQIPQPERMAGGSELSSNPSYQPTASNTTNAATVLENVQVTADGLFLRTRGSSPDVKVQQDRRRSMVNIELQNTTVTSQMQGLNLAVNRHGIQKLQVSQVRNSPPVARISLNVNKNNSGQWQATATNLGGVIVLPPGGSVASNVPSSTSNSPRAQKTVTIEDIQLSGAQILIKTDSPFTYTHAWDQSSGAFQISIPSAQLSERLRDSQTNLRTVLSSVQLLQTQDSTVVIRVRPAQGVQIKEINQPSTQVLSLQLQRATQANVPSANVPPANNPTSAGGYNVPKGRIVIAVDPGHGGRDVGAVGIGGLQEAGIVLDVAKQVAALLEQNGVQAVLTRTDDREIDLEPRVQMAERVNATLFVSIHANAIDMSRPDVNGLETYYYASGQQLAQTIHRSLLPVTGGPDRGVRQARFYVLRKTSMPAVLLELGFVTGAQDAPKLANAAYRQRLAEAITRGILQYIQQNR